MAFSLFRDLTKPKHVQTLVLLSELGQSPAYRGKARELLAAHDPVEMVRLVCDPHTRAYRTGPFWEHVKRTCPSRWQLVHWVYADSPDKLSAVYKDRSWLTVCNQSDTLATLVDQLLVEAKPRYSWMWRRTLYGYAFGQGRGAGKYTRKVLHPPGGKRRVLYVPHRPLARVQKALLRLVLNSAQESLPDYVMGGRVTNDGRRRPYGIFQNAAAHVGQCFIASFDIKDFFPSVRISEIVRALRSLRRPAITDTNGVPLPWTSDTATFVARLVTHRGRLPQGAPTSPAIANLVFQHYDEAICQMLGGAFVYTRYFDDLTVSVSDRDARSRRFNTDTEFRRFVAEVINQSLSGSPFRLNARKTRSGRGTDGVVVTGLRVDREHVSVCRPLRRTTRALLHRIASPRAGFTTTALHHYGNADFLRTRFDARHDCHRDSLRRLSVERMAVMALRRLCGGLAVEIPSNVTYGGGRRIGKQVELHEGKQAFRDVGYLLSKLWQLHVRVTCDEGHILFRDADDRVVARLRCERNDGFFLLEKKEAFASLELWHRLHGLWSGLNPRSHERMFEKIHAFRDQLRATLDAIHIPRQAPAMVAVTPPADGEIISLETSAEGEMKRNVGPLWALLIAFRDACDPAAVMPTTVAAQAAEFRQSAKSMAELKDWLAGCRTLVNATCSYVPCEARAKPNVWQTLCVLDDRMRGKRGAFYLAEKAIIKKGWYRSGKKCPGYEGDMQSLPGDVAEWIQAELVADLRGSLEESLAVLRERGRDAWKKAVQRNADSLPVTKRVAAAKKRLCIAAGKACWKTTGEPVFLEGAVEKLTTNLEATFREPIETTAQDALGGLFAFGAGVYGPLFEQLSGDMATVSEAARAGLGKKMGRQTTSDGTQVGVESKANDSVLPSMASEITNVPLHLLLREEVIIEAGRQSDVFEVMRLIRNWHSHVDDHGKHETWVRLLTYVAKVLGRHFTLKVDEVRARGARNFALAADLPLSPLEAVEVMLTLCDRLAAALETLAPTTTH